MKVYLTGEKERANPRHVMFVCPGRVLNANDCPRAWREDDGSPKTFEVVFTHGMAVVDNQLGEWLVSTGQASRTPRTIVRAAASVLGRLARAVGAEREQQTQY